MKLAWAGGAKQYAIATVTAGEDETPCIVCVSAFPEIPLLARYHLRNRFHDSMSIYTGYVKQNGKWKPYNLSGDGDFRFTPNLVDFTGIYAALPIVPEKRSRKELIL